MSKIVEVISLQAKFTRGKWNETEDIFFYEKIEPLIIFPFEKKSQRLFFSFTCVFSCTFPTPFLLRKWLITLEKSISCFFPFHIFVTCFFFRRKKIWCESLFILSLVELFTLHLIKHLISTFFWKVEIFKKHSVEDFIFL